MNDAGVARRSRHQRRNTATRSASGVIRRVIGTAATGTPSETPNCSRRSPGEDQAWRLRPLAFMNPAWPATKASDSGTVVMWMSITRGVNDER